MAKKLAKFINYYWVLGVPKDATPQKIQQVFWDLARRYHPDVNSAPLAEERYKQIVAAYHVLKSPVRRSRLDAQILTASCQYLAGDLFCKEWGEDKSVNALLPILMDLLVLENVTPIQEMYGQAYPQEIQFKQLLFVGPPGAGKSQLVNQMHAWPEESSLDLSAPNWWQNRVLAFRPRELHLLLPFGGHAQGLAVFAQPIVDSEEPCQIDFARIVLPPPKKIMASTDWRKKYVFEFLLPDPEHIFAWRRKQGRRSSEGLTLPIVEKQHAYFEQLARYLHVQGFSVMLRKGWDQPPLRFFLPEEGSEILDETMQWYIETPQEDNANAKGGES